MVKQSDHSRENLLLIIKAPSDKPVIYNLQITNHFQKAPLPCDFGEISWNFGGYIQSVAQVIWKDKMLLLWMRLQRAHWEKTEEICWVQSANLEVIV